MPKRKWISFLGAVVLLCGAGCGSGSSSGNSQLNRIESDVSTLLQVTAYLLEQLPDVSAPTPQGNLGTSGCINLGENYCADPNSTIVQCETPDGRYTIDINECEIFSPDGSVTVDGNLLYASVRDWPSGNRQIDVVTPDEHWIYGMTFGGTELVGITVESLIDGTLADCVGSLETFVANCELVGVRNPL